MDDSKEKKIIGYTTGVFDLFHIGHLNILKRAKENCDFLIVGVATDEITKDMKGMFPVVPFEERIKIVESIKYVDMVMPKDSLDNMIAWKRQKFDIYFKGDDWKNTEKGNQLESAFKEVGVEIFYFPYTKGTSSTHLKRVLRQLISK